MNFIKNFALLCAITSIVCGLYFLSNNRQKNESVIILGTMSGWPPYSSINSSGQYEGLDIDLAQIIAQKLNKKLQIIDMDTAGLIPALQNGQVDFIMTGLDITYERLKQIDMIPYQGNGETTVELVFWENALPNITCIKDIENISGAVICVEPGSSQEDFVQNYNTFFTVKLLPIDLAITELKRANATAIVMQKTIFENAQKQCPQLTSITIPLDEQFQTFGNGIGIKKENKTLRTQIQNIIDEMKRDGTLEKLKAAQGLS